jgi:dsDNA-specific endonuclease/ATPase MutS2
MLFLTIKGFMKKASKQVELTPEEKRRIKDYLKTSKNLNNLLHTQEGTENGDMKKVVSLILDRTK